MELLPMWPLWAAFACLIGSVLALGWALRPVRHKWCGRCLDWCTEDDPCDCHRWEEL